MNVVDWLIRLGLERYAPKFLEQDLRKISDLQAINAGTL